VEIAAFHDGAARGRGEAEGYARMLSGAPAMLDLLAALLVRWGDAVADDGEINSGDVVAWLSRFTVRCAKPCKRLSTR